MLKRIREAGAGQGGGKAAACPLLSAGWVQLMPGQTQAIHLPGQQSVNNTPIAQGVAEVPCPRTTNCVWWDRVNQQCVVWTLLFAVESLSEDEGGSDDGNETETPTGDPDGDERETVPVDQGGQEAGQ